MKKYIIMGLTALMIGTAFVGCTTSASGNTVSSGQTIDNGGLDANKVDYEKYEWVGEIMEFGEKGVHIISGDIVDIFEIDKDSTKNFYLGQTVGVLKEGGKLKLEAIKIKADGEDNDFRHTTMGEIIYSMTGKIKSIDKDEVVLTTTEGDIRLGSYVDPIVDPGTNTIVEYVERDGQKFVLQIYNEDAKLSLTIKSTDRAEKTGILILNTIDNKDIEFTVYVDAGTVLNTDITDLKAGDKIDVYAEVILESYPAQVTPQKINKIK